MQIWKRFWLQLGLWTGGILALLLLASLYGAFTRDYGIRGWSAVPHLLASIPQLTAILLLLTAFAAGMAVAPLLAFERQIPRRNVGALFLAAVAVGLAAYGLHGYVGPAAAHMVQLEISSAVQASTPETAALFRPQLRAAYRSAVAHAIQNPDFGPIGWSANWHRAYSLGWSYHFQPAASLLAAIMVGIGALVGIWSGAAARPGGYLWQPWVVAFALLLYFVGVVVLGREISEQSRVHPAFTVWTLLLVPSAVLVCLVWTTWIQYPGKRRESGEAPRVDT